MRRAPLLCLCLAGCISDLAVGMSTKPIAEDDAGSLPILDAAFPELDASAPPVDADAPFPRDAGAPVDVDAAGYPLLCDPNDCIVFVVPVDYCDGGKQACARAAPGDDCAVLCL